MNKRRDAAAILLLAALLLSACTQSCPKPTELTGEPSPNYIGRRLVYTLPQFSEKLQTALDALDDPGAPAVTTGAWQTLADGLVDDEGMKYASCYQQSRQITFTAAVEDESKKLINVGCGCDTALLEEEESKERFISAAAAAVQTAGGFTDDDRRFLCRLIGDLIDGEEDELFYEGLRCSRSRDGGSVMLILSPCGAERAEHDGVKTYGGD